MGELVPTKWYTPSAACSPVPCRWEGWVYLSPSLGRQWVVLVLEGY